MPEAKYGGQSFEEAIKYFRHKVKLPTERWTDLWEGMHARAFVVAGAMKTELLEDLHSAILKALEEGKTIDDFRKEFDEIVQRHGWSYRGSRGWRTSVIFHTNLRVAYAVGRYKQMTDKDVLEHRPYWRYIGGLSADPRPKHLEWNGMVLSADDPWWDAHYPPNGWGCKCKVMSVSERLLKRRGWRVSKAPKTRYYEWTNPHTGEVLKIPEGVDPGWAYNPGKAAWGEQIAEDIMARWKATGAKAWERLTEGDYETYSRPERIPLDEPASSVDYRIPKTKEGMRKFLVKLLGGEEKVFSFKSGEFRYDVVVNAKKLVDHLDTERAPYLPFLVETLEDPYEVWLAFERHKERGEVVLRQRIVKAIRLDKSKGLLVVVNAVKGFMEAWTIIATSDMKYLNRQRVGKLIWKRE